jgi:hypothetical protein
MFAAALELEHGSPLAAAPPAICRSGRRGKLEEEGEKGDSKRRR